MYIFLNSSGHSPANLSLDVVLSEGFCHNTPIPLLHAHNVTVPGAAAGWIDTVEKFGSGKVSNMCMCMCTHVNISYTYSSALLFTASLVCCRKRYS